MHGSSHGRAAAAAPAPEVLEKLLASHRQFLGFLESRLRDRTAAEEVLQAAFVRTLERGGEIREAESAVAWFYRLLRNALTDHHRRSAAERRALEKEAAHAVPATEAELHGAVCGCIETLLGTLPPGYAAMIRRIDLAETPIATVAAELGLTTNNATVRLHRARRALRRKLEESCRTCATHGCLDCHCQRANA